MKNSKGYLIAVTNDSDTLIPGALHIERNDSLMIFTDDYEAAKQAELDGHKIIHDIPSIEDWTYIDTPENRAIIEQFLSQETASKLDSSATPDKDITKSGVSEMNLV